METGSQEAFRGTRQRTFENACLSAWRYVKKKKEVCKEVWKQIVKRYVEAQERGLLRMRAFQLGGHVRVI